MPWKKVKPAAAYFGVSERTLRGWLKTGFPHSRLKSGLILIELARGDEYQRQFDATRQDQAIVDELTKGLV